MSLGLTGSIATGKSTALAAFADLGIPVFSADAVVQVLYHGAAVAAVEGVFPGVARDGAVDRSELSRRLVAAPHRLGALEAVVHPLVRERMAAFRQEHDASGAPMVVLDIPLLFETGQDYGLDAVAVTVCDEAEQRRRALSRPGMTVEKFEAILARQLPQAEKRRRADFVIDTNGPVDETAAQIRAIAAVCLERALGTE